MRVANLKWAQELQYDYGNVDHFVVQTGDYLYQKFYYNDKHQVTRVDNTTEEGLVWVRHEFTYGKDLLAEHKWISYYNEGRYEEFVFAYEYKNQWNFRIKETNYSYQNGNLLSQTDYGSMFYRWHTPFELGTYVDPNSEPLSREVFSKNIKSPAYNYITFPYGYYGFDEHTKRDLMNLKAKVFNCPQSSGMLQIAFWERGLASERLVWELKNIKVNRQGLPESYDRYFYIIGSNTPVVSHFECKYISL